MRVVIQRVTYGEVFVAGESVGKIGNGILVLWGLHVDDKQADTDYCVRKVLKCKLWPSDLAVQDEHRASGLRIQPSASASITDTSVPTTPGETVGGVTTWAKSVTDLDFEILVVSQFTLYGSLRKGNKPDYHDSMRSEVAKDVFASIVAQLKREYKPDKIKTGRFGSYMDVRFHGDGPVTIILDSKSK